LINKKGGPFEYSLGSSSFRLWPPLKVRYPAFRLLDKTPQFSGTPFFGIGDFGSLPFQECKRKMSNTLDESAGVEIVLLSYRPGQKTGSKLL
jgi:hypothetical protein